MKDLGTLVTETRQRRGIATQRELGVRLGKDPAWVSRLENGTLKETPAPEVMHALADVLGVGEAELLEATGYRVRDPEPADAALTVPADDPRAEIVRLLADVPDDRIGVVVATIRAQMPLLVGPAARPGRASQAG